jgi:transposase
MVDLAGRRVLVVGWLHDEIAGLYDAAAGRPSIDPEVAVRLMLAGFLLGIVHDRRLLREAQVNLAIRWFCGYGLHEALPDHSSLTRIRQRWGAERFRRIFERTVRACVDAKIAEGEVVHVDASLIRADVSWESLAVRHVEAVSRANEAPEDAAKKVSRQTGRYKKMSVTDPDATMATTARNRRLEPAYKQHAVVDDLRGVILDVEVTTGEVNEGQVVVERIDATMATTGSPITTVTADAGYAYAKVYGALERRGIDPLIPSKAEPIRSAVPLRRVPLRCQKRRREMPARQDPATGAADQARPLLLFPGQGLRALPVGEDLPVAGARQQGGGDQRSLPGAAARPTTAGALVGGGPASLPASPLAVRRLPRRGQDLARVGTCRAPRARQHAHPGPPDRRRDQPEAARRHSSCGPSRTRLADLCLPSASAACRRLIGAHCDPIPARARNRIPLGFFNSPTQQRTVGQTFLAAFQKPRAPSPVASSGGSITSPFSSRRRTSSSCQLCSLSPAWVGRSRWDD